MLKSNGGMRPTVAVLVAILALMAVVPPVAAGSPQRVTIVSHVTFNPDGLLNPSKIFPSRRACTEVGRHTTTSTAEIGKRVDAILRGTPL